MTTEILKMSDHAMYDTSPLRYGVIPPVWVQLRNMEYDDVGTQNQKPKEIRAGNKHYVADCYCKETDEFLFNGRFVVGKARRNDYYDNVISVLSIQPDRSQRAVSEVIRDLRLRGKIDANYIKEKIFPLYSKGEFSSVDLLMDFFVKEGVEEQLRDRTSYIERLESESERKDEELREKDAQLSAQAEKIRELEQKKPDYRKSDGVDLSPVLTLKEVIQGTRTNRKGQVVACTTLRFEEPDTPDRIMDEWADPNGKITARAKSYIGKKVITSSWQPHIFKPLHWWRDIYLSD